MINTVRTTIRIRKDLFDQSKRLAYERNTSLQNVINDTLTRGFSRVAGLDRHKEAMARIDKLREQMKGKKIDVQELVAENKRQLEERSNRLLKNILRE